MFCVIANENPLKRQREEDDDIEPQVSWLSSLLGFSLNFSGRLNVCGTTTTAPIQGQQHDSFALVYITCPCTIHAFRRSAQTDGVLVYHLCARSIPLPKFVRHMKVPDKSVCAFYRVQADQES